jgi:broad specificity phosphatase PhoE
MVDVQPERPSFGWHLSKDGRTATDALAQEPFWKEVAVIVTSPEPKAIATGQRVAASNGLRIELEPDVREVEGRPWVKEGYSDLVRGYLHGQSVAGWEPREAALDRWSLAIERLAARAFEPPVAVVAHGLVITVYLAACLGLNGAAAFDLWAAIRFPDVALLDTSGPALLREFGPA